MEQEGVKYDKAHLSAELLETFKLVLPDLRKKYDKPWSHYEVDSAWVGGVVVGQHFYIFHVKEGEHAPYHNYTVNFEINHGKTIFKSAQEGYLSIL